MADKTRIEWTEATWNPVTGCTKVSAGCKHCYAERDWARLSANPATRYYGRAFTDVQCHADVLDLPLQWKRPRRIFVNSMSDLFHEAAPDDFIASVFRTMAWAHQHSFQVLTKRPDRMLRLLSDYEFQDSVTDNAHECADWPWPLANVWLGVSVEDQATADERIPLLLQTPAAVRWISAEPLLGPVDLGFGDQLENDDDSNVGCYPCDTGGRRHQHFISEICGRGIDWVVVGGESGPKARPMHPDWVRGLRDQCAAAGVPFLFKQWGEWLSAELDECPGGPPDKDWMWADGTAWSSDDGQRGIPLFRRVGKHRAGRRLDSELHDDYPETAPHG